MLIIPEPPPPTPRKMSSNYDTCSAEWDRRTRQDCASCEAASVKLPHSYRTVTVSPIHQGRNARHSGCNATWLALLHNVANALPSWCTPSIRPTALTAVPTESHSTEKKRIRLPDGEHSLCIDPSINQSISIHLAPTHACSHASTHRP